MKLEKLLDVHVVTGVALGALIGLHYSLVDYKLIIAIVAAFGTMKVVGLVK